MHAVVEDLIQGSESSRILRFSSIPATAILLAAITINKLSPPITTVWRLRYKVLQAFMPLCKMKTCLFTVEHVLQSCWALLGPCWTILWPCSPSAGCSRGGWIGSSGYLCAGELQNVQCAVCLLRGSLFLFVLTSPRM